MTWRKALAIAIATPALIVGSYVGYLWASYISESTTSGSAHGFTIGSTKAEAVSALSGLQQKYPETAVDVTYGRRAGDHFTVAASAAELAKLARHNQWDIFLDGQGEFGNSIRLTFQDESLAIIYRHRQYFELP